MKTTQRRSALKKLATTLAGIAGIGVAVKATASEHSIVAEKEVGDITFNQDTPLYSGFTKFGNLVFLSGIGAHFEGDITAHTDHVLKELEMKLKEAGSSIEQVLKVNVFLADLNDYKAMNEVYKGRFGAKPPVRTTVATYGGVPGNSLVEIDCIAYVK